MVYDFLVIGGGLSGMSVAIILASHGRSVALVEKDCRLAPTIRGFRRNGLFFDSGFHYAGALGKDELLGQMLEALGVSCTLTQKPLNKDAFDCIRLVEQGIDFEFCCGWQNLKERLIENFPEEESAIARYLDAVRNAFEINPRRLLKGNIDIDYIITFWQGQTLETFLNEITDNAALKCGIRGNPIMDSN